jgi:hypothetical protein
MIKSNKELVENEGTFFTNLNKVIENIVDNQILIETDQCVFSGKFSDLCILLDESGKLKIVDENYKDDKIKDFEVIIGYLEDEIFYFIARNESLDTFTSLLNNQERLKVDVLNKLKELQRLILSGESKTDITLYARTIIPKGISTRNQQIYKFFFENNYLFLEHHFTVVKKMADDKIEFSKKNLKERSLFITDSKLSKFNQSENKLEKLLIDIEKEYDIALNNFSDEEIKNYCINLLDFFKL